MPDRCPYLAHTPPRAGMAPDLLKDHLRLVADRAASSASAFGAADEARLAGLLHDLGKYRTEFQEYLQGLRESGSETHHAAYGAACAFRRERIGAAFSVAGHHAGLHDLNELQLLCEDTRYQAPQRLAGLLEKLVKELGSLPPGEAPRFMSECTDPHRVEFYVRMLFSCLVDADRLETERYSLGRERSPATLANHLDIMRQRVLDERSAKPTTGQVNAIRHEVFDQCLTAAELPQGFFTLTVPTGGGKTLASMAFALTHAKRHGLRRVIVVIPFLSIIEQNATEYRRILDPLAEGLILKHHCAVEQPEGDDCRDSPAELAAENWDAPIVVTTSVQFIESLFAASPTRCRKLHNVARAIVIMDEVQTLPTHLLNPLLSVMRELKRNYGVSFLLATATQPAFSYDIGGLKEGFQPGEVVEVCAQPARLFSVLKRTQYYNAGVLTWDQVAEYMAATPRCMCVVNVRRHAFTLWERLRDRVPANERNLVFHLSSAMCAEHRLHVLGGVNDVKSVCVRALLAAKMPCRLVTTQVVEAGVDVDFPEVLRAMGPLDSIIQAAGRCNREGKLTNSDGESMLGRVTVFTPEDPVTPPGVYKTATGVCTTFLSGDNLEMLGLQSDLVGRYFRQVFQLVNTDHPRAGQRSIQQERADLHFRTVAAHAHVIRDDTTGVVVPYGRGADIVTSIRNRQHDDARPRFDRHDLRSLQRFMVNVSTPDLLKLKHYGHAFELLPHLDLHILQDNSESLRPHSGQYHACLGLLVDYHPLEDLCGV